RQTVVKTPKVGIGDVLQAGIGGERDLRPGRVRITQGSDETRDVRRDIHAGEVQKEPVVTDRQPRLERRLQKKARAGIYVFRARKEVWIEASIANLGKGRTENGLCRIGRQSRRQAR